MNDKEMPLQKKTFERLTIEEQHSLISIFLSLPPHFGLENLKIHKYIDSLGAITKKGEAYVLTHTHVGVNFNKLIENNTEHGNRVLLALLNDKLNVTF